MDKAQLEQRIRELDSEAATLRTLIAAGESKAAQNQQAIRDAQRRYDLQGDDSARGEIEQLRSEIYAIEETLKRQRAQLAEYPVRVSAIREEISLIQYSEDLRRLATEQQTMVESFNEYTANLFDTIDDCLAWQQQYESVRSLGQRLEDFARSHNLPLPRRIPSVVTQPESWFFQRNMGTQTEKTLNDIRNRLTG